jgi:hypothetical protein
VFIIEGTCRHGFYLGRPYSREWLGRQESHRAPSWLPHFLAVWSWLGCLTSLTFSDLTYKMELSVLLPLRNIISVQWENVHSVLSTIPGKRNLASFISSTFVTIKATKVTAALAGGWVTPKLSLCGMTEGRGTNMATFQFHPATPWPNAWRIVIPFHLPEPPNSVICKII